MRPAPLLITLLAACAATPPAGDEVPADRRDVAGALYQQFDEVLERRAEIRDDGSEEAQREREELDRLADEIAVRIVRIDPDADVDRLVKRLERAR